MPECVLSTTMLPLYLGWNTCQKNNASSFYFLIMISHSIIFCIFKHGLCLRGEKKSVTLSQMLLFISVIIVSIAKMLLKYEEVYYSIHSFIHLIWSLSACDKPDFRVIIGSSTRGFPGGSEVKASACSVGDLGSIPGLGRSPGEGNGNPLQYACLENPMDGGAWWIRVHGVAKSRTQLRDFKH